MFLRTALLILRKDFAIEIKTLEIVMTTLFFAVACVLVFSFAFVKEGQAPPEGIASLSTGGRKRAVLLDYEARFHPRQSHRPQSKQIGDRGACQEHVGALCEQILREARKGSDLSPQRSQHETEECSHRLTRETDQ